MAARKPVLHGRGMVCVGCCRSASFDEGGARGLLLNNLMVKTRLGPALPAPSIRSCKEYGAVLPSARVLISTGVRFIRALIRVL